MNNKRCEMCAAMQSYYVGSKPTVIVIAELELGRVL